MTMQIYNNGFRFNESLPNNQPASRLTCANWEENFGGEACKSEPARGLLILFTFPRPFLLLRQSRRLSRLPARAAKIFYEHAQVSLLAGYPTINNCDSKLYPGCLMLIVDKGKPNKYILQAVDKTRNMEHSGTCRNIPEHPGTSRNMKKILKF